MSRLGRHFHHRRRLCRGMGANRALSPVALLWWVDKRRRKRKQKKLGPDCGKKPHADTRGLYVEVCTAAMPRKILEGEFRQAVSMRLTWHREKSFGH